MVIYFSGTGNSRYVAERIAEASCDGLIPAISYMHNEELPHFCSDKPFVFVSPVYAWRMPRIFEDFIRRSLLESPSLRAYFIVTCASSEGASEKYCRRLAEDKGLEYLGFASVIMPENYMLMFKTPTPLQIQTKLAAADPVIAEISEKIANGSKLLHKRAPVGGKIAGVLINSAFYSFIGSKGFRITEGCIGCGKCEALCPTHCISINDGKPVWTEGCTHCMACISGCPHEAIEYKNKTVGKARYRLVVRK